MKTLLQYINELSEGGVESQSTFTAKTNIENIEPLYQKAMKARTPSELKKAMLTMQDKFTDKEDINFKKVDWSEIWDTLNESIKNLDESILILEGLAADLISALNKLIEQASKEKNKKTLEKINAEIDAILKKFNKEA